MRDRFTCVRVDNHEAIAAKQLGAMTCPDCTIAVHIGDSAGRLKQHGAVALKPYQVRRHFRQYQIALAGFIEQDAAALEHAVREHAAQNLEFRLREQWSPSSG